VGGAHLVVVGDGPERAAVHQRAADLDVLDAVTFAGAVPHRDTPAFYRAADVFALSSEFDNSPNALLEAMASGLPIVSTDVGGVREFVDVPDGGAIVPSGDAGALAGAIERYMTSPSAARAAGVYNRRKAASEFSWSTSAADLLGVYRRVVRAPGGEQRASA
jgi:phenylacetate-CoA ligase